MKLEIELVNKLENQDVILLTDEFDKTLLEYDGKEESKDIQVFTNKKVFDSNYIPENLRFRSKELSNLANYFSSLKSKVNPSDLSIFGRTGTGKTATIKYAKQRIETHVRNGKLGIKPEELDICYVNCKEHNSHTKVYSKIAREITNKDIAKEGHSSTYYLEGILEHLNENDSILVAMLDEIDLLHRKEDLDDTLYSLTDKNDITTIMISNNPNWQKKIEDERVLSRMGIRKMTFSAYNKDQLKDILRDRASVGLTDEVWDDEVLDNIAEQASRDYGDARQAIKLLKESAELLKETPWNETIKDEHVDKAADGLDKSIELEFIRKSLAARQKLILYSLAFKENKTGKVTTSTLLNHYNEVVKDSEDHKPISKSMLYRYLNEFENYELIEKRKRNFGRGIGQKEMIIKPKFDVEKFLEKADQGEI